MRKKVKKSRWKPVAFVFVFVLTAGLFLPGSGMRKPESSLQKSIAKKIIRLHVVANSDSGEDQQLKLKVKEGIVKEIEPLLCKADSVEESRAILSDNLERINQTAQKEIQKNGFSYESEAKLSVCRFPVKEYGEFVFPAGDYEALKITIGEAEGKNWWCVVYPRLCFVDSLYSVVPESSKKTLKASLTDEEYHQLLKSSECDVKIKFKFMEWLKKVL